MTAWIIQTRDDVTGTIYHTGYGRYGFVITLGSVSHFKPLFTSDPVFDSDIAAELGLRDAIAEIRALPFPAR